MSISKQPATINEDARACAMYHAAKLKDLYHDMYQALGERKPTKLAAIGSDIATHEQSLARCIEAL